MVMLMFCYNAKNKGMKLTVSRKELFNRVCILIMFISKLIRKKYTPIVCWLVVVQFNG